MALQDELSKIRNKSFQLVYTLIGTEKFLIESFKDTLKKEIMFDESDDLNVISFDMTEIEIGEVIHEAETIPFFGDRKVIFVENPYFLTPEKKKNDLNHDMNALENYLKNPLETTVLVFVANVEKLDERKKIVKLLKKESTIISVAPMDDKALKPYVKKYIESEGFVIDKNAFEELLFLTDMNLTRVMNELDKLFLYKSHDKKITKQDVTNLIPKSLEHNIFDLSQHVLGNQAQSSVALYQDLRIAGEETIKIISILLGQIRLLLQIKILTEMNYQQSNMTDTLKIHPYRIKLGVQQSRSLKKETLGNMLDELVELDYQIKTGQIDKELGFEMFLLKTR